MRRTGIRMMAVALIAIRVGCAACGYGVGGREPATIAGSKPSWAQPANRVGDEAPEALLQFRVYLQRDAAAAEAAANDLSNPRSPRDRQWMTPDQVLARFGPSAASARVVSDWLSSNGFTIVATVANRLYVEATGTAAQVQQAFGVQLAKYNVRGRTVRGPDRDLSVPASLASSVLGVIGVDQAQSLLTPAIVPPSQDAGVVSPGMASRAVPATPNVVPPPDGFRNARPCSQFWAEQVDTTDPPYGGGFPNPLPYADCGHVRTNCAPSTGSIRHCSSASPARATVAIIDAFASPTIFKDARVRDAQRPRASADAPISSPKWCSPNNPALEPPDQCDAPGWYGEETLDVEAVHAMAPGREHPVRRRVDCPDMSLDKALNPVVAKHLAQIVSNSYGDLGEDIPADEVDAFQRRSRSARVLEGIGVYFSSGDNGDEVGNLGMPSADFSASSPWVTAVGGTSLGVTPTAADGSRPVGRPARARSPAIAVTRPPPGAFLYGSGGGTSTLFAEPRTSRASCPTRWPRQNQQPASRAGSSRTSRWTATRTPACSSARPRRSPSGVQLRRVPHRRNEPVVAAVRRDHGAGRRPVGSARTGSSTRRCTCRSPARRRITDVVHARSARSSASTTSTGSTLPTARRPRCARSTSRPRDRDDAGLRQRHRSRTHQRPLLHFQGLTHRLQITTTDEGRTLRSAPVRTGWIVLPFALFLATTSVVWRVTPAAAQTPLPLPQGERRRRRDLQRRRVLGRQSNTLRNGSFETPAIPAGSVRTFVPSPDFYWQTTASDGDVELWNNHADGGSVPTPLAAADGAQIAELNANEPSAFYQDVRTNPGDVYVWSLPIHGRAGVDTMAVEIGPPSAPVTVRQSAMATPLGEHMAARMSCRPGRRPRASSRQNRDRGSEPQHRQLPGCPSASPLPGHRRRRYPRLADLDTDNDGLPDSVEGTGDIDGDNIPNWRDPPRLRPMSR